MKKKRQKRIILTKETVTLLESSQQGPLRMVAGGTESALISGEYPCERNLFCVYF